MTILVPPVLRVKPGVRFEVIAPAGFRILAALDGATKTLGFDLWITCGSEDHLPTDPHTKGEAYDLSVRDMTVPIILKAKRYFEQVLGSRFTVLYEVPLVPPDPQLQAIAYVNGDASAPHFHIQRAKGSVYPPTGERIV